MPSKKVDQVTEQQFLGLLRTALAMGLTRQQILRGRDKLETALRAIQTGAEINVLPRLSQPSWAERIVEISVTPRRLFSLDELSAFDDGLWVDRGATRALEACIPLQLPRPQIYVFVQRSPGIVAHHKLTTPLAEAEPWARDNDLRLTNPHDLLIVEESIIKRTSGFVDRGFGLTDTLIATETLAIAGCFHWATIGAAGKRILTGAEFVHQHDIHRQWYLFRR